MKNPTPPLIKRIRDGLLFIVAGSLTSTPFLAPLFSITEGQYAALAGITIILIRGVSMMIGVTDEEAVEIAKKTIERIEQKQ